LKMVRTCGLVLAGIVAATAHAQSPTLPGDSLGGWIEGTVVNDRTGLPLKRANVVLRPAKAGVNSIAVETDDKGVFAIRNLEVGRYSLSA
jgi:Carboxypeptidase regulatory-like domain